MGGMQLLQGVRNRSAVIASWPLSCFVLVGDCVTPHHSAGAVGRRLRALIGVGDALALATQAQLFDMLPWVPVTKARIVSLAKLL